MNAPPLHNTLVGLSRGEKPLEGILRETLPASRKQKHVEGIIMNTLTGIAPEPMAARGTVRIPATRHEKGMNPYTGRFF